MSEIQVGIVAFSLIGLIILIPIGHYWVFILGPKEAKEEEKMRTSYIAQLPIEMQNEIKNKLINLGLCEEDIEKAMNSRLCDLEDTLELRDLNA